MKLFPRRIKWCGLVARERLRLNRIWGSKPGNNAPDDDPTALRMNVDGIYGEAAAMLYLSPCCWNYLYTTRPSIGIKLADIDGFVDVKWIGNPKHRLIVKPNENDDFAYLLVDGSEHPWYTMTGWLMGREAKIVPMEDPVGGRPAHFIDRALLRDPAELLTEIRRRRAVVGWDDEVGRTTPRFGRRPAGSPSGAVPA